MNFANRIDTILEDVDFEDEDADLLPALRARFQTLPAYLNNFGISIDNLDYLGSGCQGTAYSDGVHVVKFTEDDQEARAASRVLSRGGVRGISKIMDVKPLGGTINWHSSAMRPEGRNAQFYVIIQELLNTKLTPEESSIAEIIGDFLVEYYHREDSPKTKQGQGITAAMSQRPPGEQSVLELAPIFAKAALQFAIEREKAAHPDSASVEALLEFLRDPRALEIAKGIMEAVIRLYYEAGVRYFDVQPGNLGKDSDGNYVLFDLGISTVSGKEDPGARGFVESPEFKDADKVINDFVHVVN